MTTIQLIVGLGNPGPEYGQTWHNVGTPFVERLAHARGVSFVTDRKYFGLVGEFDHRGKDVRLLTPTTYMNRSGQFVAAPAGLFRIALSAVPVARDELDMPLGVAKLKAGGGHGGYDGLHNIIVQLDNQNSFYHLRPGIGHPGHNGLVSSYVLGRAPRSEQELLDTSIDFALGVPPEMLIGDQIRVMQKLHGQKA